jgi:hypothetical protein
MREIAQHIDNDLQLLRPDGRFDVVLRKTSI